MDFFLSASGIRVTLNDSKMWKNFHPKTEMIVTKRKGRVIFPHLKYNIEGLDPETLYQVHVSLERADNIKYKYDSGEWHEFGKGDPILSTQLKEHPDGARPGSHWMKGAVSFGHLKITNDPENTDPKLILVQSMHKYRPVVTIQPVNNSYKGEEFRLQLTEFFVVTAYQSEEMIKLKVTHNKFASGFRSNGKRKNSLDSEDSSPKRHSPSSESSTSTSPALPQSFWDQPLNQVTPIVFNQNAYPNSSSTVFSSPSVPTFPMQNQFIDFPTTPANQFNWYPCYPGVPWNFNQFNMNMDQWNSGENAPNPFGGI